MKSSSKVKRVVIIILTIVMIFTSLGSLMLGVVQQKAVVLAGDSTTRRTACINMAKGKSMSSLSADGGLESLTYDDLRMLGVFISNYYIPWSTSLGIASDYTEDDDGKDILKNSAKTTNANIVKALHDNCNFDKSVAKVIAPMVLKMAASTAKPLKIGRVDANGKIISSAKSFVHGKQTPLSGDNDDATVLKFFAMMAGDYATVLGFEGSAKLTDKELKANKENGGYYFGVEPEMAGQKFVMYWEAGGTQHIVWDSTTGASKTNKSEFTACTTAYGMLADTLNYNEGWGGNAIINTTITQLEKLSKEDQKAVSVPYTKMYVDCFGDIIADLGTDQVIVVPACINPYTWTTDDGSADNAGQKVNLVNLPFMGEIKNKHITQSDKKDSKGKVVGKQYDYYFEANTSERIVDGVSLFTIAEWRVSRGNTNTKFDPSGDNGYLDTLYDDMKIGHGKIGRPGTGGQIFSDDSYTGDGTAANMDNRVHFPNWLNYTGNLTASKNTLKIKQDNKPNVFQDFLMIDDLNEFKKSTDDSLSTKNSSSSKPSTSGSATASDIYKGANELRKNFNASNAKVLNEGDVGTFLDKVLGTNTGAVEVMLPLHIKQYGSLDPDCQRNDGQFKSDYTGSDNEAYLPSWWQDDAGSVYLEEYSNKHIYDNGAIRDPKDPECEYNKQFFICHADNELSAMSGETSKVTDDAAYGLNSEFYPVQSDRESDCYNIAEKCKGYYTFTRVFDSPNTDIGKITYRAVFKLASLSQYEALLGNSLPNESRRGNAYKLTKFRNACGSGNGNCVQAFIEDVRGSNVGGLYNGSAMKHWLIKMGEYVSYGTENKIGTHYITYKTNNDGSIVQKDTSWEANTDTSALTEDEKQDIKKNIQNSYSSGKAKSTNNEYIKATTLFNSKDNKPVDEVSPAGNSCNFSGIKKFNEVTILTGADAKLMMTDIYLTYLYAFFGADDGTYPLYWKFNIEGLPKAANADEAIDWSDVEVDNTDERNDEILSMIYYVLHPSKGISYVSSWVKNKVGGVLVNWHEDMSGNASATSTTGTTRYIGFSGYVTVPSLHDLSWTDWLLDKYDNLVVYFIIIIIVIMLGYAMLGSLTFQRAMLGALLFALCAYLPPRAINATVDVSNKVCDSIYADKFSYWALVQHQQYTDKIDAAVTAADNQDEEGYLQKVLSSQVDKVSAAEYATVTVKWMCPKKDNYLVNIKKEVKEQTKASSTLLDLYMQSVQSTVGGESYLDSANALYLYRSYVDIGQYSRFGYEKTKGNTVSTGTIIKAKRANTGKTTFANFNKKYLGETSSGQGGLKQCNLRWGITNGFNYGKAPNVANATYAWRVKGIFTNKYFEEAIEKGIPKNVNYTKITADWSDGKSANAKKVPGIAQPHMTGLTELNNGKITDNSSYGDFIVSTYTESPYYYFSYNLSDQLAEMGSTTGGNDTSYKGLFLASDESSYFYNMKAKGSDKQNNAGYGELRDYMDMRSLFTTVIPYLKSANDVVVKWDDTQGLFMYEDAPLNLTNNEVLDDTALQNAGVKDSSGKVNKEMAYKVWHNLSTSQLFNMYTPWVDTMYDCNYAKPETITVMGKKFTVEDPLDPLSYGKRDASGNYTEGRPMIFSESEMKAWGLNRRDLTTVEQKILNVNESCYNQLLQLMDYYTFSDNVLNTASAMIETFEFNKEFSQTNPVGADYIMYPQAYELKNFSYDAYLRLILSGSTGEDIATNNKASDLEGLDALGGQQVDFYQNLVQKSSILAGIMLVIVDFFACYAIPALKLFFIVAIFFLSILMLLVATIKIEMRIWKTLLDSLVMPLLKFLAVSVGMAFFVSLFMYNGNTEVTGRQNIVISLGDPVMCLLVMLVINAVVLILYFKICKGVLKNCIKYGKAVFNSVGGMIGGIAHKVSKGFKAGFAGAAAGAVAGGAVAGHMMAKAGQKVRETRDRVVDGSDGSGGAANVSGDPSARGAENTDNHARVPGADKDKKGSGASASSFDAKIESGKGKIESNVEGGGSAPMTKAERKQANLMDKADAKEQRALKKKELSAKYTEMAEKSSGVRAKMYGAKAKIAGAQANFSDKKATSNLKKATSVKMQDKVDHSKEKAKKHQMKVADKARQKQTRAQDKQVVSRLKEESSRKQLKNNISKAKRINKQASSKKFHKKK